MAALPAHAILNQEQMATLVLVTLVNGMSDACLSLKCASPRRVINSFVSSLGPSLLTDLTDLPSPLTDLTDLTGLLVLMVLIVLTFLPCPCPTAFRE